MASRPSSARTTAPSTVGVRRNLFHHHLSRRPTSTSTSTSTTTLQESIHDDSADIVVKDRNGTYRVQVPSLPPLDEDEPQDEELSNEKENELEARMLELYKEKSTGPGEQAELLAAVQASLRRKVAALDESNWMFEAEKGTPES